MDCHEWCPWRGHELYWALEGVLPAEGTTLQVLPHTDTPIGLLHASHQHSLPLWKDAENYEKYAVEVTMSTVEPLYNKVLGTMKITLLYQVSHYIRVKKQRNIKSWDQQNDLVIRGFCYIRPLYNEVPLYYNLTYSSNSQLHVCQMPTINMYAKASVHQ